jgi:pimeloyl-ACP methyl ester carboxylesterase
LGALGSDWFTTEAAVLAYLADSALRSKDPYAHTQAHTRRGLTHTRVLTREATHEARWRQEHTPGRVGMKAVYLPNDRAFLRYIEVPGDDPPLLWLHGWQCSATGELMPAAVQAPLRGRRSLLIDFLGHGYSDKPPDFGYAREDHARTIVALIDALGLSECGLVGHSMGGAVAVHVATARATIVSLLIMAEAAIDAGGEEPLGGQTEDQFVERGFGELIEAQSREAEAQPDGLRAAHLAITRLVEPRAIHREAVSSLERGTNPSVRSLLRTLQMPRWYLQGEESDPEPDLQHDLAAMGVGWKVVPKTGHPMGLQNPEGLAQTVAEVLVASWPR